MTTAAKHHAETGDHDHDHPDFLQHHFDTPAHQMESSKMGMWLFLVTEVLLFSGLFCAYAVYRANHPDIFLYAHHYLDRSWGAINTVVLLFSSFTMAWAVRSAQLNHQKALVILLAITFLCGCGFLCIKFVEYKAKFEHDLLWGLHYKPHNAEHSEESAGHDGTEHAVTGTTSHGETDQQEMAVHAGAQDTAAGEDTQAAASVAEAPVNEAHPLEVSTIPLAADSPSGLAKPVEHDAHATDGEHAPPPWMDSPKNVHIFFGIYFVMTGLHGLHVIIGMTIIAWLIVRTLKGHFSDAYYTPVDLGGLYWHLVDLIWIYLFPLLYLIH